MKSLKTKLTVLLMSTLVVSIVAVTGIGYSVARRTVIKESLAKTTHFVSYDAEKINTWFTEQGTIVDAFGRDIAAVDDMEHLEMICTAQASGNPHLLDAYVGFEDDTGFFGSAWVPEADWKATTRPWYQAAKGANGNVVFTEPYLDTDTGKLVITAAKDIGKVEGKGTVSAIDLFMDTISEILSAVDVPDGGYIILTDQKGDIIYHMNKAYLPTENGMTNLSSIPQYTNVITPQISESIKIKDHDDVVRYMVPATITVADWKIYAAIPEKAIVAPANSILAWMLVVSAVVLIFSVFGIWFVIMRVVVDPIKRIAHGADDLARGDLNFSLSTNNRDEIGHLSNDMMRVHDTLTRVVDELTETSKMHGAGEFTHQIDSEKFTGAYKEMAVGINQMTSMYAENFMQVLKVFDSFSKGDFNAEVKRFPGKLYQGNQIIETLRDNLRNVNKEISLLAQAAIDGRLDVRAQAGNFDGDWKKMIVMLNNVIEAVSNPIDEVKRTLLEMSKGNMHASMTGQYKGEFKQIEIMMNETIAELRSYIEEISKVLSGISGKDLRGSIDREYIGDFAGIKSSINMILTTLNSVLSEIADAAETVNSSAKQVSEASGVLSDGAQDQAVSIDRLMSAMSEINHDIKNISEKSDEADLVAATSMDNAAVSSKEIKEMLDSMQAIKAASGSIANIVKVIDDISFQTNILAINASIEAARAGEHGAGFAVVANEVKSLATRSQESAQEISGLIDDTIVKIGNGTQTAERTSGSLLKIISNVDEISKIIAQISEGSKKQVASSEIVTDGLNSISGVVTKTTAISEENSASAQELLNKSDILSDMVGVFKFE